MNKHIKYKYMKINYLYADYSQQPFLEEFEDLLKLVISVEET